MFPVTSKLVHSSSRCIVRYHRAFARKLSSNSATTFADDHIQRDVIRDIFHSYARYEPSRRDPFLCLSDLRDLLISIGDYPSDARLSRIVDAVDKDASGTVELNEFMEGYHTVLDGVLSQEETSFCMDDVVRTFCTIDRNGDGVISMEELTNLLETTGGHISKDEALKIMKSADTDGNGVIDLPEFIALFRESASLESLSWRLRSGFRAAFVIGGPGSGKADLCEQLILNAGMVSCDMGSMLREEVEAESPLGKTIAKALEEERMVSSSTAMALLRKKLSKAPGLFVAINGFPRSKQNCEDFEQVCGAPEFSVYIDLPEDVMIERLLEDEQAQLANDIKKAETLASDFTSMVKPMLEYLDESGTIVHKLDGRNSASEIWEELLFLEPLVRVRANAGVSSCFLAL